MYKITINGFTLHDDSTDRTDDKVTSAIMAKEEDNAGTLMYTIAPNHQFYDDFGKPHIGNYIKVYENRRVTVSSDPDSNRWEDIVVWQGRPISWSEDFEGNVTVNCESDVARLNDIVYPGQESFSGTLRSAFTAVMDYYKAQSGYTIPYSVDSLDDTKTVNMSLQEGPVFDTIMSIIQCSEEPMHLYYDYFPIYGLCMMVSNAYLTFADGYNHQEIWVDKNLIDITKDIDYSEFATAIIPRDSDGNGVESVNGNSTVVVDSLSHSIYGHIEKIVTFDEPAVQNNPSALLAAAKKWFKSANNTRGELDVTALDLSVIENYKPWSGNDFYRPFAMGQVIYFNGTDTTEPASLVVRRIEVDLLNPANSHYGLALQEGGTVHPVSELSLASEDSAETFASPRAATSDASGYIGKKSDISYMLSKANMDKSKTYDYGNGITCRVACDYDIWLYGSIYGNYGTNSNNVYGVANWLTDGNNLYPELGGGVVTNMPGAFYANAFCDPGAAVIYVYNGWVSDVIRMPDLSTVLSVINTNLGESWTFENGKPYVGYVGYNQEYENSTYVYIPIIRIGYVTTVSNGTESQQYMVGINGEANSVTLISNAFTNIRTGEKTSNTCLGMPSYDSSFSPYSLTAVSKPDSDSISKLEKWRTTIMDPSNKGYKVWSVQGTGIPKTPPGGITDLMKKSNAGGYYYVANPPSIYDSKIQKQIGDKIGKYDYMWASGGVGIDIWDVPPAASEKSYSGLSYGTNIYSRAWKAAMDSSDGIIGVGDANNLDNATGTFKGQLVNATGTFNGTVNSEGSGTETEIYNGNIYISDAKKTSETTKITYDPSTDNIAHVITTGLCIDGPLYKTPTSSDTTLSPAKSGVINIGGVELRFENGLLVSELDPNYLYP